MNLLWRAIERDDLEEVRLILCDTRINPQNIEVLRFLCKERRTKMLRLLLNDMRIFPGEDNNILVRQAAATGDLEIVSLLMDSEKVDVTANDNEAMKGAMQRGDDQMQRILSRQSNYRSLLD